MKLEDAKKQYASNTKIADEIISRSSEKGFSPEDRAELAKLESDNKVLETKIEELTKDAALVESFSRAKSNLQKVERSVVQVKEPGELQYSPENKVELEAGMLPVKEVFYRAGHWANATFYNSEKSARICREKGIVARALSEGSGARGGYSVPEDFVPTLIDLLQKYSSVRKYVRVENMIRDTKTLLVNKGGAAFTYISEAGTYGETNSEMALVNLVARKAGAIMLFSNELSEDSAINIGEYVLNELAKAAAQTEQNTLWNADGTATYGGITGIKKVFVDGIGTLAGSVEMTAGHDKFSEIDAADINLVISALPENFEQNGGVAKFYCSHACKRKVFDRLQQALSGNSKEQTSTAAPSTYQGYEIVTVEVLPTTSDSLDALPMFYFGDPKLFVMLGDRRSFSVQLSNEYKFDTDQFAVKGSIRHDVAVFNPGTSTVAGGLIAAIGNIS